MRAIRVEAPPDEPLRFPWSLMAIGLLLALTGVPVVTLWLQGAATELNAAGEALGRLPWLLAAVTLSLLSLLLPLELSGD